MGFKAVLLLVLLPALVLLPGYSPLWGQFRFGLSAGGSLAGEVYFRGAVSGEYALSAALQTRMEIGFTHRQNPALAQRLSSSEDWQQVEEVYLELPFLLKGELRLRRLRLYGLIGPQAGLLLGLSGWKEAEGRPQRSRLDPERVGVSRIDLGLVSGLGLGRPLAKQLVLVAEVRYYLGVHNLMVKGDGSVFNQGHLIAIGFQLPVGRDP